ncbi:MAG TPA: hypothetical protein VGM80_05410 [Gaiellaceae bacterium]
MTTKTKKTLPATGTPTTVAGRPAKAAKVSTPWGPSTLVEEARVPQSAPSADGEPEKKFATLFQLLEPDRGEPLIRIAYTTDGVVRRGPVTMRARDMKRLLTALESRPALAAALHLSERGA